MQLDTPLSALMGIGPILLSRLKKLNLNTVEDLLNYYPFRYEDYSHISSVMQAQSGEKLTLSGEVWSIGNTYTKFRKVLTKAIFNDGSGPIEIIWFNQPWLIKSITSGDKLQISGKIKKTRSKIQIISPQWEKLQAFSNQQYNIHTGRLVPVYSETYGLTSKWLRAKISQLLPNMLPKIIDYLSEEVRQDMLSLPEAITQIHFPANLDEAKNAYQRLAFDELFLIQLATLRQKASWQNKTTTYPIEINSVKLDQFINDLPFRLTNAQLRVIKEISHDLSQGTPMNRLVQGEVGSGKTVVAAAIIFLTYLSGLGSVVMAPTEILAFQHYQTLDKLLGPYGIQIGLYTGSKKFTKQNIKPEVIVGTHALLSDQLSLANIGLAVIDEQQRFGVEQRTKLRHKAKVPHFLTMTATPIPRTVALTLYGDLDLSVIDELPKGRKVVRTYYVPESKRADSYRFIENEVKNGSQVYIITPLIEQSETLLSAKAAKVEFERLSKDIFPKLRLGLLHGRLKSKEKEKVIADFKLHNIDILVSTSVVEVGVDVPNATVMAIEGADRFGLAQLHQLRGRVGRGEKESFAFLFAEDSTYPAISRLKNLEKIHDGLQLSELDLQIRGSGQIYGTMQSGSWELKIASLTDLNLLEKTRNFAQKILQASPNLDKYPQLKAKLTKTLAEVMPD
ncbi:ATP-dependent DNA helicase RecG [Patescibacteria group bacterium]|nr:ATP-dependent DNA helicase RecG [Patescibacteria group bacterium]